MEKKFVDMTGRADLNPQAFLTQLFQRALEQRSKNSGTATINIKPNELKKQN